ncbi:MAG: tRNA (guanosine(37)-N1)-methyltransferase TrmD [Thermomicrobiales bacterium]
MKFDIFTIFPGMFESPFAESIIQRAKDRGIVEIHLHDIREHGLGTHRSVDDTPFGGGPGMVMSAPPIIESVEAAIGEHLQTTTVLLMTPSGERLDQRIVEELAACQRIAIICGRYEGVDQRVIDLLNAREISIGDYVVSGGELPAAIVVDAVTRLLPGVINSQSLEDESHLEGLLEYPHYTRPAEFRGLSVPDVLLSGHHGNIRAWRREMAEQRTRERRPDLLEGAND